jgi:hypothetical protein
MSAAFRNGGVNPTTSAGPGSSTADPKGPRNLHEDEPLDNSAYQAAAELPPGFKLGVGIGELVIGAGANVAQVSTSTLAWFSMITHDPTPALVTTSALSKAFPWIAIVSLGISLIVQSAVHMNAQGISSTWTRLRHIQNFHIKSTHAINDVVSAVTWKTLFGLFSIAMDIVSDATFVNLITRNGFVVLVWICAATGGSTILMYDGAVRVWGAMEDYKDYTAYHEKHDIPRREK